MFGGLDCQNLNRKAIMHLTEHNLGCNPANVGSEQSEAAGAPGLRSISDEIESFNDVGLKAFKAAQNTLSFKWLSILKDYLEGRLWVVMEYRVATQRGSDKISPRGFFAILNAKRDSLETDIAATWGFDSDSLAEPHFLGHGNQDVVLIRNIEEVQPIKSQLPSFVWLYSTDDRVDNGIGRRESKIFMSIDGALKRFLIFPKGKEGPPCDLSAVGFHHDTVSVVEGGPEVMNGIAENGWGVLGEGGHVGLPLAFQPSTIFLGPQSLHVARDVSAEYDFELVDVMFGPFYL
jgi:hypothetical protein